MILSGGAGTRLWPLSRPDHPKQFLPLTGERSMLQATVDRLAALPGLGAPVVVTSSDQAHVVDMHLAGTGHRSILEPARRNTAPAVAAAAIAIEGDPVLLVLPSDHAVTSIPAFKNAVIAARSLAEEGYLVTFGVVPTYPETGYGYIRAGRELSHGGREAAAFVEKPDRETAARYLESGEYLWNSGMFVFRASRFLEELERWEPEILDAVRRAVGEEKLTDRLALDPGAFSACPSESIDFAVMERSHSVAVVPLDAGWSDVGSWAAVGDIGRADPDGNVTHGDVVLAGTRRSIAWSESRLVTVVGIDDVAVVETPDAVLVAGRSKSQQVKDLVGLLRDQGRREVDHASREIRPWGSFEILAAGDRYQVKRLVVNPGAKLSLQSHRHRAEEWTVVNGTARVTLDDEIFTVAEGNTASIPIEGKHRLENPGHIPLVVIEVQLGSYLGEDDIVRYADEYGRG